MKKENELNVGGMHIELFLPTEPVREGIVMARPIHGSTIVTVQSGVESIEDCDAVITENRALTLGMRTADCAPICLYDGTKIGIAHVGWLGLSLGLIEKTLSHFAPSNLSIYVAPFLHSFEIKRDFCYDKLNPKFSEHIKEHPDKLIFNFKDAINSLLPRQTVYDSRDTAIDLSFPSYRRDKTKQRFLTAVSFLAKYELI